MTNDQFDQLLSGISLLVAETHISNHLANLACRRITPSRNFTFPGAVYMLAEQFKEKIEGWGNAPNDFDLEEFFIKTFGETPRPSE